MEVAWKPGCKKEVEAICTELNDMVERNKKWFEERDHWKSMQQKELPEIEWEWAEGFYIDTIDTRRTLNWRHRSMAETSLDGFVFECSIPGVKIKAMFHDTIDHVVYVELTEDSLMPKFIGLRPIAVGTRPLEWRFL